MYSDCFKLSKQHLVYRLCSLYIQYTICSWNGQCHEMNKKCYYYYSLFTARWQYVIGLAILQFVKFENHDHKEFSSWTSLGLSSGNHGLSSLPPARVAAAARRAVVGPREPDCLSPLPEPPASIPSASLAHVTRSARLSPIFLRVDHAWTQPPDVEAEAAHVERVVPPQAVTHLPSD